MRLTFRQVRYFVAVADSGQVSSAGASIGIAQSAITEAIKALEEELGVKLFERRSKGLALTQEGHHFLSHARRILSTVSDAAQALRSVSRETSGTIRVGMTYTVIGYFITAYLARFRRAFPNVKVEVLEYERPKLERELSKGTLDLAVMLVSNLQNHALIESRLLVASPRQLWLPPNHDFMRRRDITLADVATQPYIMLTCDESEKTTMRYWQNAGLAPDVLLRTSSIEAVRSLVAHGSGVAILSDIVFRQWSLEGDRLEARPLVDKIPSMDIGLGWPRRRGLNAPAQAFVDFCLSEMRRQD
ncbi:MAG: LysR family transcriptional regulator [Proteobacteria bacterium]|nr:LysR family transcriptional regulator [Pseudomonadota bacterium]MBS0550171.1 LysR family transcriptional regulator [Pseudomonadota bacterium]